MFWYYIVLLQIITNNSYEILDLVLLNHLSRKKKRVVAFDLVQPMPSVQGLDIRSADRSADLLIDNRFTMLGPSLWLKGNHTGWMLFPTYVSGWPEEQVPPEVEPALGTGLKYMFVQGFPLR